jgi:hypothetical protein
VMALVAAALAAAGCSSVLGLKDPTFQDDKPAPDAAVDAAIDTSPAACGGTVCLFGCDTATNACRDGKLWVFPTTGQFLGDGVGGRDGADARCLATYTDKFTGLQCNRNRMHAVLTVGPADTIALMASKFTIPTNVPVNRADDNVLVSDTWNDLTDTTKQPRAPVTSAATEPEGIVWTGANGTSTCVNWTSQASTDNGVRGHTTLTVSSWMIRDSSACNLLARLLCVCWSGGE